MSQVYDEAVVFSVSTHQTSNGAEDHAEVRTRGGYAGTVIGLRGEFAIGDRLVVVLMELRDAERIDFFACDWLQFYCGNAARSDSSNR
jgi:hypothetical protein